MKLISPSFEIIEQENTLNDVYKHIELCGRTCYKSTDKITEDSAKPFVDRMINSNHGAMLEHGTIYMFLPMGDDLSIYLLAQRYNYNKYSICKYRYELTSKEKNGYYVTTNLRVLVENDRMNDLHYLCEPTEFHEKRYTVKFICNRQVSHEFVRHRTMSFAQESTRYCNYTKDKFGGELTFIKPIWCSNDKFEESTEDSLLQFFEECEKTYFALINRGWKPQQAATVLPNAIKTELVITGTSEQWKHFFDLRALGITGAPHPQAKELAYPLYEEFIRRGYIKSSNT